MKKKLFIITNRQGRDTVLLKELEEQGIETIWVSDRDIQHLVFQENDYVLVDVGGNYATVLKGLGQVNSSLVVDCSAMTKNEKQELLQMMECGVIDKVLHRPLIAEQIALCIEQKQCKPEIYRHFMDKMNVMALLVNSDKKIIYCNQAFYDETQYKAEEIEYQDYLVLNSHRHSVMFYNNLEQTLMAGMTWSGKLHKERKDGTLFWEEASVFPLNIDGTVYYGKTSVNVTRREEMLSEKKKELLLASEIQKSLLSTDIITDALKIRGLHRSLESVSGDIYYWEEVDPGVYSVFLADVVGHGISSALMTTSIISIAPSLVASDYAPDVFLRSMNQRVMKLFKSKDLSQINYFTAAYLVLDFNTQKIQFANCGHPPILCLADGVVTALSERNFPIGLFNDVDFTYGIYEMKPHMQLLIYTDGIIELNGKLPSHVADLSATFANYGSNEGPDDLISYIEKTYLKQVENQIQDDVTLIGISIGGD